jgi:hypothetical protein
VRVCAACNRNKCVCSDANGPKQPYDDGEGCDHEYDEDEDALEYVCNMCGDRQKMDLTDLLK